MGLFIRFAISVSIGIKLLMLTPGYKGIESVALWTGSALFIGYAVLVLVEQINIARGEYFERIGEFTREIANLDRDQWNALGFKFPSLRIRLFKGELVEYFEDTKATRDHFVYFLRSADDRQISPIRQWGAASYPRWAHHEIRTWLESNNYIYSDSAAGNHSWLWVGSSYRHLCSYWLPSIQEMPEGS